MPEYLAPGVYVEETSFRAKSIEGVSTSTTAFVGPTRRGPIGGTPEAGTPEVITSFGDFERIFGGLDDLSYGLNYLAHAVRAYFDNGGSRLYVVRAFTQASATDKGLAASTPKDFLDHPINVDKRARLVARFPGEAGNGQVVLRQVETPVTQRGLTTAPVGSLVRLKAAAAGGPPTFYVKKVNGDWVAADSSKLDLTGLAPGQAPGGGADILTISVDALDKAGHSLTYENLGLDHDHPRWIGTVLAPKPARRADSLQNLFAVEIGAAVTASELQAGLFPRGSSTHVVNLPGGNDGAKPTVDSYKTALADLEKLEDISIVAAPGHSAYDDFQAIQQELLIHVEARTRYRVAVLDTPPQQALSDARLVRSRIDSKYAALYYPWVVVANPLARPDVENIPREIGLPPSGFVCGIYARTDIERGVYKAPANEVVAGALRFESDINFAQQGVLNPLGINCFRYFPGRGYRLWGARTVSSDPEWKYVNVRRYFNYLESSIDRGTQWAVFEPNGELLWANIRGTIGDFLYNEWRSGALLGATTEEAYFVRCDRSTMTQNDLDNGRLVCLIGVAALKPAEFVIFRIGQKTADARN